MWCRESVVSRSWKDKVIVLVIKILSTLHNGHYLPVQYNTVLMSLRLAHNKLKAWVFLYKLLVNKTLVNVLTPSCDYFRLNLHLFKNTSDDVISWCKIQFEQNNRFDIQLRCHISIHTKMILVLWLKVSRFNVIVLKAKFSVFVRLANMFCFSVYLILMWCDVWFV